jgi:hypothetical protein
MRNFPLTLLEDDVNIAPPGIDVRPEAKVRPQIDLPDTLIAGWPCFSPSDFRVYLDSAAPVLNRRPQTVVTGDGKVHPIKFVMRGNVHSTVQELKRHRLIKARLAELNDKDLLVSRLHGLVIDPFSHTLVGMLFIHIDSKPYSLTYNVLYPRTSVKLRQRWAEQIRSTLARFHEVGVVWGDARPENILIDREHNAWITNFGGGSGESPETRETDERGLERIIRFIITRKDEYKEEEIEEEEEVEEEK